MRTAITKTRPHAAMFLCASVLTAFLLTAGASVGLATPIEIDNFDAPNPAVYFASNDNSFPYPNTVPSVLLKTDSPGILGGQRDMQVKAYAVPDGAVKPYSFSGEIGGWVNSHGVLATATKAGTALTLQYDGNDPAGSPDTTAALADAKNLGLIDLTDGGLNDRFELSFGYLNTDSAGDLRLRVTVESDKGTALFQGMIPENDNPFFHFVKFNDFAGYNADPTQDPFANAQSVTFELNYPVDNKTDPYVDVELRDIQAVPEPSTVAMGAMGGLALVGHMILRRRRANKK